MKKNILLLTILGLLSFSSVAQKTVKRSIELDKTGYSARSCVIDGEIYSTNNHPYLESLCSLKGGETVTPTQGRKIAKEANKIDKICCRGNPRYTWTLTRGKASEASCSEESVADRFCYRTNAIIANAPKGLDYDPEKAEDHKVKDHEKKQIGSKVTSLISKRRGYLKHALNSYSEKANNCGVDQTFENTTKDKQSLWNRATRYVGEKFKSQKHRAATKFSSEGAPVCCQQGNGKAVVVANRCACDFKSSLSDESNISHAHVVPANKYQCPELNKLLKSSPADVKVTRDDLSISASEEKVLKDKLANFIKGHNKCEVINRASLPLGEICKESSKNKYFFLDINCGEKEVKQMICHEQLKDGSYKTNDLAKKDCHMEG